MDVRQQEKILREQAKGLGLVVQGVSVDDGKSAANDDPASRPGFVELCLAISNDEVDYISATRDDRLARDLGVTNYLINLCVKHNVKQIVSGTIIDLTASPGTKAIAQIGGVIGEMESAIKKARNRDACQAMAERGQPQGGRRPFGYNADRRTLHPIEAPAYKRLYDLVIEGHSLSRIARIFEAEGILDRNKNRFSVSSLSVLVKSERAIGNRVHRGKVVGLGKWTPITTPEKRNAALAALKSRQTHLRGSDGTKRPPRLLSSLLKCGECGATLRVTRGSGVSVYACAGNRGCGAVNVNAEYLEEEIEKRFLFVLTSKKTAAAFEKLRRQAPDTSFLCDEIERLKMEMLADATAHANEDMSRDVFLILLKGKQERLNSLTEELEAAGHAPGMLAMTPNELAVLWSELDLDERRRRLSHWIESATVRSTESMKERRAESGEKASRGVQRRGSAFDPERVEVSWRC